MLTQVQEQIKEFSLHSMSVLGPRKEPNKAQIRLDKMKVQLNQVANLLNLAKKESYKYNFEEVRTQLAKIGLVKEFDRLIREEQLEYEHLVHEQASLSEFIAPTSLNTARGGISKKQLSMFRPSLIKNGHGGSMISTLRLSTEIHNSSTDQLRRWTGFRKKGVRNTKPKEEGRRQSLGMTGKEVWAGIREGEDDCIGEEVEVTYLGRATIFTCQRRLRVNTRSLSPAVTPSHASEKETADVEDLYKGTESQTPDDAKPDLRLNKDISFSFARDLNPFGLIFGGMTKALTPNTT